MGRSCWLLLVALAASAAVQAQPSSPSPAPLASNPGETIPGTLAQITRLPEAVRERFTERVLAGDRSRQQRLERLVAFVFDRQGLGMVYEDGTTHTVEQALAARRGNCLSFALLFLALAREAGFEAQPRIIEQTLSWHRKAGVYYRSSHINVEVRLGPRRYTLDVARDAVITRGQPVRLGPAELLAHYHNNRAMELQARGDLSAAQRHMQAALALDPEYPGHWSNAGVLALRRGDAAAATRDYDHALRLDPGHANALFNRLGLARREGDRPREHELRERLTRVQQKDPFHHFLQAADHDRAGDLVRAVQHYRTAIALHRGDHRFHAALADALQRQGDIEASRVAFRRAASLSEGDVREFYRRRLREPASN